MNWNPYFNLAFSNILRTYIVSYIFIRMDLPKSNSVIILKELEYGIDELGRRRTSGRASSYVGLNRDSQTKL